MSDPSWKSSLLLKLINIIVYFTFLASNIYTFAAPGGIYYHGKETYITPAPWAFLIWPLIHALLLGTLVYQFFPRGGAVIVDGISWRLPLLGVLNAIYVSLWASRHFVLSFILSVLVSGAVTSVYVVVRRQRARAAVGGGTSVAEALFVHLPFSLWHGWTTVLLVISAFSAFGVNALDKPAGPWTKTCVFLALFFLEATAAAYAFAYTKEGDLAAALAVTWGLWGIVVQQTSSEFVHWSAVGFAGLALVWVGKGVVGLVVRGKEGPVEDEERAPLLVGDS